MLCGAWDQDQLEDQCEYRHDCHQTDDQKGDAFPFQIGVSRRNKFDNFEQRLGRAPRKNE